MLRLTGMAKYPHPNSSYVVSTQAPAETLYLAKNNYLLILVSDRLTCSAILSAATGNNTQSTPEQVSPGRGSK